MERQDISLGLRHHWGPQYTAHQFQGETQVARDPLDSHLRGRAGLQWGLSESMDDGLGDSVRGGSKCTSSPADINYEETLSTLRYADQAKKIVNKAVRWWLAGLAPQIVAPMRRSPVVHRGTWQPLVATHRQLHGPYP